MNPQPYPARRPARGRGAAGAGVDAASRMRSPRWPAKPVTMIVPFPAGGGTDAFARPLAAQFAKQTGKQLIIDNRGGAGGTRRRQHRGRGRARRLHLLHGRGAPHDRAVDVPQARLRPREGLRPARRWSRACRRWWSSTRSASPATDFKAFLELMRKNPGKLNYALGRQRHLAPPGRRAVQAADQDLHHPHSLPRRRPGAAGPDRRPGRHDVRRPGLVGRAHQGRPHQGARWCRAASAPRRSPTCRAPPRWACRTTR